MVKSHLVNGPHSAGIFADMSIDGPEIGTLVLIVDRAKNLPNRKTIGKQDPYCAARLGKEAKKTTTDIRGGQTPRWDQELRFTVHDGPDYFQLKLSVFNDDKKTELIGEAWIDLRDIIITGGGQKDLWQNLSCKGKYAGDIRIEITFYDSRPKPDKPAAKAKPVTSDPEAVAGQHKVPKRRPLPSDPFTGQAPAQPPQPAPSHIPTPPRSQPSVPRDYVAELSTPEHSPAPYTTSHAHSPSAGHHGNTASPRQRLTDNYSSVPGSTYQTPSDRDRYPVHPDDLDFPPSHQGHTPDRRYTPSSPYGPSPTDPSFGADFEGDRPPPPPAHRITPGGTPEIKHQAQTLPVMRKDVLRNEAHRQSAPPNAYPGRPVYRGYDSSPAAVSAGNDAHAGGSQQQASPPRHQSYDAAYEAHHRSLQPTVEDVPDSPGPGLDDYRRGGSRASSLVEADYQHNPSPPPLNLSGRNGAPSSPYNASYRQSGSPDYSRSDDVPGHSPSGYSPRPMGNEYELPDTQLAAPASIPIPASLIPGMDPALSMEISQRVNEAGRHDRRHTQPPPQQPPVGSMRGRQMNDRPPSYVAPPEMPQQHLRMSAYHSDAYERNRSPGAYAVRGSSQHGDARRQVSPGHSPMGHSTIRRKSVSPAPVPESHRLSGVPFGPDDYNALNPALAVAAPKEPESRASREYDEIDGVIITHDGREVDPSDHLPMDTWAPEPEPKAGKTPGAATSSRPALSGPQPLPSSGRKALRIRERPASSMAPSTYIMPDAQGSSALPPPGSGRNRLQKKANRNSAMPVMMSGANGSGHSPLAPLTQPHGRDDFMARPPARASTLDYENRAPAPMYDMPPQQPVGRDHSASAPPIPAKIPISSGGALVPMGYGEAGGDAALMEEMSRIDIGSGRARRHAQRSAIGGY